MVLTRNAKNAMRLRPLAGTFAALLALALIPGCPPPTPAFDVDVECGDGSGEALLGEVVEIAYNTNDTDATVTITADGGTLVDNGVDENGDGTAILTSTTEGTVTVTVTGTLADGTTDTETCEVAFAGTSVVPSDDTGGAPVASGGTINLEVDVAALAEGGGEGDDFTVVWSVNPAEAGTFSCGEGDQDPEDDNDTDCFAIGFTVADPCVNFSITVVVTRNSDGRRFGATSSYSCIECAVDADCDDGLFCTGSETCVDGACVDGTAPCDEAAGETCNEDADACEGTACTVDADCSDGVFCNGNETCVDGACVAGTAPCAEGQTCDEAGDVCVTPCDDDTDCDNGLFCDGTETCVDGACADGTSPCAEGQDCDEETDTCGCTEDADCDDGLFCNGTETCDVGTGVCVDGTEPCNVDETCDEENDDCIPPTGGTFRLTTGVDAGAAFTGGSGDDVFDASLEFQGGVGNMTLGNSDNLNGGAGNGDRLFVQTKGAVNIGPAGLGGIEEIEVENTDSGNAAAMTLTNADSVTSLESNSSANAVTFAAVQTLIENFGMSNTGQNMTVTISGTGILTGTDNEGTLTLSTVTAGVFTAQPSAAGSGYEIFNVVSTGSANTLTTFSQGNGNSLATMNFSGDQNLTITNALPTTVLTVNASDMTGALSILLPAVNITVTGGSGNDTINDAGNYSTADTLNGGDGTGDKLTLNSAEAGAASSQSNVSNFEIIQVANALDHDIVISRFGSAVNQINLLGGTNSAKQLTIPVNSTVEVATTNTAHQITVVPATDTTSDAFNMNVKVATVGGNIVASLFETLNLAVTTNNATMQAITLNNTAATEKVVVTGTTNLTIAGVVTADQIDASAFTGNLVLTGTPAGAIQITGGSGNDTLLGSASADILTGGAGNDILNGQGGADTLTGSAGNDTFRFANAAAIDTVSDWADGSDLVEVSSAAANFDAGAGLAARGGAAGSLNALAVGSVNLKEVAQNASASAVGTADFIKLTTGVAFNTSDQVTFNAAIGTATVTGLTATTNMMGSFYDTTNSRMVLFEVVSDNGTNTVIETGDTINVIARISMSSTDYTNFTTNDIFTSDF
ncbi:MAG: hypothetical protein EDS66_13365 [Planctomycetota bacterium]|nr:MAG: hypothetical protein EDS66_13365 [Planctomycetota bacterium]MCQ3922319.1 hypothetical protein [Planctomycetota bacterium]